MFRIEICFASPQEHQYDGIVMSRHTPSATDKCPLSRTSASGQRPADRCPTDKCLLRQVPSLMKPLSGVMALSHICALTFFVTNRCDTWGNNL